MRTRIKVDSGSARPNGCPLHLAGFSMYAERDLIRMRGPFVQALLFGNSRTQTLDVVPAFYVVGAYPADSALFQTMSIPLVDATGDLRWLSAADAPVEEELAQRLLAQVEQDSPLSFIAPLQDESISMALEHLVTTSSHWLPALSKAFFAMCMGSSTAAADLARARDTFIRLSNVGRGGTPRPFERDLMARFDDLNLRLQGIDCIAQCRKEAEEHAARLGLPAIACPPEWPTRVDVGDTIKNRWLAALLGKRPGSSIREKTERWEATSGHGKRNSAPTQSEKRTGRW